MTIKLVFAPNRKNIRKWVGELRSGKYQQGTMGLRIPGVLGLEDKFCCLGVACEISGIGHWNLSGGNYLYETDIDSRGGYLPVEVTQWLGLDNVDPELGDTVDEDGFLVPFNASVVNDAHGWTFEQIADALEAKYLSYGWEVVDADTIEVLS